MSYDAMRTFADSWGLVLMGVGFLAFVGWALLPTNRARADRAAHSIFEEDRSDG